VIALLGIYCGLRSSGEIERRATLAFSAYSSGAPSAAELSLVEPFQAPVSQH